MKSPDSALLSDAIPAEARTTRLKQQRNERCRHRSGPAPLVLVLVICLAGLVASCGAGEDTTLETVGDIGPDSGSLNDDGASYSDSGDTSHRQTDDPSEDSGPVELVRVPDVIGLTDPPSGETESGSIDVVSFLAQHGVTLPPAVAGQFAALSEADQQQRLLSLGVDRSILHGDIADRPMPLVAELLRVLDPDAPRPEVASDADYARSMIDVAAGAVIADLQGDYSSRLGFARWDDTPGGDRVFVIPVVGASQQEVRQIEAMVLPDNTPIRVESTDISYQDLRELKDAVYTSIRATTGDRLGDWSIGIDSEPQTVFVRVDLSLERNKEILASINSGLDSATATVDDGRTGNKQTGDLLAGLTAIVHDVANSFVVAEIPSSSRTGAELVTFADAKMDHP